MLYSPGSNSYPLVLAGCASILSESLGCDSVRKMCTSHQRIGINLEISLYWYGLGYRFGNMCAYPFHWQRLIAHGWGGNRIVFKGLDIIYYKQKVGYTCCGSNLLRISLLLLSSVSSFLSWFVFIKFIHITFIFSTFSWHLHYQNHIFRNYIN